MQDLSVKIAKYIIPENELSKSNIDIIAYGIEAIISTFATSIAALLIAVFITNKFKELLMLCITFLPIRGLHKGYHCKTFLRCLITSNIMILCATGISDILPTTLCWIGIPILLFVEYQLSVERMIKYTVYEFLYILILIIISKEFVIFSFLTLLINNILIIGGKYNGISFLFKKRSF